jgi:hypothetical protein
MQRGAIVACWLVVATICSIVICAVRATYVCKRSRICADPSSQVYNFTARYVLLVFMAAALWSTNGLSLSYMSSTFGAMPQETRAVSLALVNALGNLAQIYGAYLFPSDDAPKYLLGFGVISGMCAFGVLVYAVAHVVLRKHIQK